MNAQLKREQSKSGGVLVMAMIVMLTFSILALGLFKLFEKNSVEVVYAGQSKQAFWVAESGLQDAIQRLRYDTDFHSSAEGGTATFSSSNNLDTARYDVTVRDRGDGDPIINWYRFDVESVGWVRDMNRQIRQTIDTIPGYIAAIMAPKNINIAQNTLVKGPIAVMDGGVLTLDDKIPPGQSEEGDYDIIILDDGSAVSRRSGANEGEHYDIVDLPAPEMPTMPDFSSLLTTAQLQPENTATNLGTIDLGGGTHYYNVPDGITIESITGGSGGTIVNTGGIILSPKSNVGDVDIVADVSIYSFGAIDVGQKNDFSGDTLLYAAESIYFGDQSIASQKSVLLADGTDGSGVGITMGGHSQFEGILFADDGTVVVQQGSNGSETRIEGTVISGEGVDLGQNSEVIFNRDMFNDDLFDLSGFFKNQVIVTRSTWEELPSLP